MERNDDDQAYSNIVTCVEGLYDFHPGYFDGLMTEAEARIVGNYYWLDREITVDDIFEYRRELIKKQPEIRIQAEAILRRLFAGRVDAPDPADTEAWLS